MVQGKSGKGKLEASCNQSRSSGVNRVSVRLKISLPVAEPARGKLQSAQGSFMPRVVLQEGLWLLQRFRISGMFFLL